MVEILNKEYVRSNDYFTVEKLTLDGNIYVSKNVVKNKLTNIYNNQAFSSLMGDERLFKLNTIYKLTLIRNRKLVSSRKLDNADLCQIFNRKSMLDVILDGFKSTAVYASDYSIHCIFEQSRKHYRYNVMLNDSEPWYNSGTRRYTWDPEMGENDCLISKEIYVVDNTCVGDEVKVPSRIVKAKEREAKREKRDRLFQEFLEPAVEQIATDEGLTSYKHWINITAEYVHKIVEEHIKTDILPKLKEIGIDVGVEAISFPSLYTLGQIDCFKGKIDILDGDDNEKQQ